MSANKASHGGSPVSHYDVFNGDADGLCALQQLRLVEPRDATLITGVKRDIALLQRVPPVRDARVTVLDISLNRNRAVLTALLDAGALVAYFDHHAAGDIPQHPGLQAHIDTAPDVCTSVLVDRYLGGAQRIWAVVGAFGDNMDEVARALAKTLDLSQAQIAALQDMGQCLNYNAYGTQESDLFISPELLFRQLQQFPEPAGFIDEAPILGTIRTGQAHDLELASKICPYARGPGGVVYVLPDAPWSRRVRGVWGNQLVREAPGLAHALLTPDGSGCFVVSVRAPLRDQRGADRLCAAFASGGGRPAAAGIDRLEPQQLAQFVCAFHEMYVREAVQ